MSVARVNGIHGGPAIEITNIDIFFLQFYNDCKDDIFKIFWKWSVVARMLHYYCMGPIRILSTAR